MAMLGEWKRVKKLEPINTFSLVKKDYRKIMMDIEAATLANQQIGVRSKGWFYNHNAGQAPSPHLRFPRRHSLQEHVDGNFFRVLCLSG